MYRLQPGTQDRRTVNWCSRTLRAEGVDVAGAVVDAAAPTDLLFLEHRIADVT